MSLWERNRPKFAALQRIWREQKGFVESFALLGVNLSDVERVLAEELDRRGRRPKGFFKIKVPALVGNESKAGFNESGEVALVDFAYDEVEANIEAAEVAVMRSELPSYAAQLPQILAVWRPHFSIPPVKLPAKLVCPNADTRRRWFGWARERVEAAWRVG